MKLTEVENLIGELVMSTDPYNKLVKSFPLHGPCRILRVQKGGLVRIEEKGEERLVPARQLHTIGHPK